MKNTKTNTFFISFKFSVCFPLFIFVLLQIIILQNHVFAQQRSSSDTLEQGIASIPIHEITRQATRVSSLILEKQKNLLTENDTTQIVKRTDTLIFRINLLREDPRVHKMESLNFRILTNLEGEWSLLKSLLLNEEGVLTTWVQKLENEIDLLQELSAIWQNTLLNAQEFNAPEIVIQQIKYTIESLEKRHAAFQYDSEFLQERLVQVSKGLIFINEIMENINSAREVTAKKLFELNDPPIWKVFKAKKEAFVIKEQRSFIDDTITRLKDFLNNYSFRIWLHLMLFLIIFVFILFSFRNLKHFIAGEDIPQAAAINKIIRRPVSSILLISFLLTYILYETIPESVRLINLAILLVPVLIILTDIITKKIRRFVYFIVVSVMLVQIHSLLYGDTLFSRIFLLLIMFLG